MHFSIRLTYVNKHLKELERYNRNYILDGEKDQLNKQFKFTYFIIKLISLNMDMEI